MTGSFQDPELRTYELLAEEVRRTTDASKMHRNYDERDRHVKKSPTQIEIHHPQLRVSVEMESRRVERNEKEGKRRKPKEARRVRRVLPRRRSGRQWWFRCCQVPASSRQRTARQG